MYNAGFTCDGGQTTTSGLTFGSTTLITQPHTTSTQTSAALSVFSLPTTASTGQPGVGQFTGVPASKLAAAAVPGFTVATSAAGVTFDALQVPSTTTGLSELLGTVTDGQTGSTSLLSGVKRGLLYSLL